MFGGRQLEWVFTVIMPMFGLGRKKMVPVSQSLVSKNN